MQTSPHEAFASAKTFGFGVARGQNPADRKTDIAFELLMSSPNSTEQFSEIFKLNNTYAQLYALCALHCFDRNVFDKLVSDMDRNEEVHVQNGCVFNRTTEGKIIDEFENGRYSYYS